MPLLFALLFIGLSLLSAARAEAAAVAVNRTATHAGGVSIRVATADFRADSVALSVTIANPGDREIELNNAQSFVLQDDRRGVYRLNPPADNPTLRIPAEGQFGGELVFIGPLSPDAGSLTLSANGGIGTVDNPYDPRPALRAQLPLPGSAAAGEGRQANHPDGASLRVRRVVIASSGCLVSLLAVNGNERAIRLNQAGSFELSLGAGEPVPAAAPSNNPDLTIPPAHRLDGEVYFPCRGASQGGTARLSSNRGTGGTPDNPYDTLPVMTVQVAVEPGSGAVAAASRVTVAPIARSRLLPVAFAAASPRAPASLPTQAPPQGLAQAAGLTPSTSPAPAPPSQRLPPRSSGPLGPVLEEAATAPRTPRPSPPPAVNPPGATPPGSQAQLEAALHATRTDRGLEIVLPADQLFDGSADDVTSTAEPVLSTVAELIDKTRPREVQIAGHTDSQGADDANLKASEQRAHAVAAWLAAHAPKRPVPKFVDKGFGRTRPVAPNHNSDGSDSPAGRAQNRRIEIILRR